MSNKIKVRASKSPTLATDYKFAGSNEYAVGRNNEVNASSKKDLVRQQQKMLTAASRGDITTASAAEERQLRARENQELIQAAFNDPETHRVLGERMAESLYITANRQGFMRRLMAKVDVAQGTVPRFPLRSKDVTAVWSTSPTEVKSQITQDKWYTPPELSIVARPFVTQNELNQSAGDVLDEKYVEATEAIMVAEDRLWYRQAEAVQGIDNNLAIISGQLTPFSLTQVMTNVTRWGLKAPYCLMASDLYMDIIGNSEFYEAIDPVARHELLLTGELATMYGMSIISDAYRHQAHKVLNRGEFFVVSESLNHGAYSDRGGIRSEPIGISIERVPGKGWVLEEQMALSISNSRSVAKGIRL